MHISIGNNCTLTPPNWWLKHVLNIIQIVSSNNEYNQLFIMESTISVEWSQTSYVYWKKTF